ncbi:MAG: endonuclease/exonuclease/phosphatase family protein [Bacteroidales bacterium]|nr:endonuclease/exonuclease/phosphatase family protein [Bacteroidales bacterium]
MQVTQETFEMAILAAPVVVLVLAGVTLLSLLLRKWKTTLIMAFLTLLVNGCTEQIPLHLSGELPDEKPEGTIRILEYNICGKVEYAPLHGAPFIDYVKNLDADILFLPENTPGTAHEFEKMLRETYPYSLHDFLAFEQLVAMYADLSIYSRYPLSNFRTYHLDMEQIKRDYPYLDQDAVEFIGNYMIVYEATADVDGTPVTLVHVHLRTNSYDSAKSQSKGKRQKVHNIYENLQFGYAYRGIESQSIADSLRNCPNPLIVCGDFNDMSGARCMRTIQNCRSRNVHENHRDRLSDAWWRGGTGLGFTFVDQKLHLRLDHILYSREFELQAVRVDTVSYSDHRPLIADFTFNP